MPLSAPIRGIRVLALLSAILAGCATPEFTSVGAMGSWGDSHHLERTRSGVKHGPAWETGVLAREVYSGSVLEYRIAEYAGHPDRVCGAGGLYREGRRHGVWTVWIEYGDFGESEMHGLEILGQIVFEDGLRKSCTIGEPWQWPITTAASVQMMHEDAGEGVRWRTPGGSESRVERIGPSEGNYYPPGR